MTPTVLAKNTDSIQENLNPARRLEREITDGCNTYIFARLLRIIAR
ncbi:Uncharacterised protein [Salmonella enterica subsp. enterica serovar Madelia]|nr:Uncharacterised protein [Salmonella enterica subsp. enterica serovar Madelia]